MNIENGNTNSKVRDTGAVCARRLPLQTAEPIIESFNTNEKVRDTRASSATRPFLHWDIEINIKSGNTNEKTRDTHAISATRRLPHRKAEPLIENRNSMVQKRIKRVSLFGSIFYMTPFC